MVLTVVSSALIGLSQTSQSLSTTLIIVNVLSFISSNFTVPSGCLNAVSLLLVNQADIKALVDLTLGIC